ncbi:hypothetical protein AC578_3174 [Pseudocercospora eumusae]|uniref:Uncharacterized protein n=1 Tax=Pseudocercospora eumusae TaxID=321146 RepID=A0A139HDW0_9PEZI|nr:hypothetical protein AC578_3174 [Pseudocercospora eumusae]
MRSPQQEEIERFRNGEAEEDEEDEKLIAPDEEQKAEQLVEEPLKPAEVWFEDRDTAQVPAIEKKAEL